MSDILAYDRYASNPDNLIIGEVIPLYDQPARVYVPIHGAFFVKDLQFRKQDDLTIIDRDSGKFNLVGFDHELFAATGIEVATGVEWPLDIVSPIVSNVIMTYRAVGGPQGRSRFLIALLRQAIQELQDNPTISFSQVAQLFAQVPPSQHTHSATTDLTDLGTLRGAVVDLVTALREMRPLSESNQWLVTAYRRLTNLVGSVRNDLNRASLDIQNAASAQDILDLETAFSDFSGVIEARAPIISELRVRIATPLNNQTALQPLLPSPSRFKMALGNAYRVTGKVLIELSGTISTNALQIAWVGSAEANYSQVDLTVMSAFKPTGTGVCNILSGGHSNQVGAANAFRVFPGTNDDGTLVLTIDGTVLMSNGSATTTGNLQLQVGFSSLAVGATLSVLSGSYLKVEKMANPSLTHSGDAWE